LLWSRRHPSAKDRLGARSTLSRRRGYVGQTGITENGQGCRLSPTVMLGKATNTEANQRSLDLDTGLLYGPSSNHPIPPIRQTRRQCRGLRLRPRKINNPDFARYPAHDKMPGAASARPQRPLLTRAVERSLPLPDSTRPE
jgi:hypothetical protein